MIHLRAVHACPSGRADARLREYVNTQKTEQLRDEQDAKRPLLHWPLKKAGRVAA